MIKSAKYLLALYLDVWNRLQKLRVGSVHILLRKGQHKLCSFMDYGF